jgi:RNA recognition motif-containing protein
MTFDWSLEDELPPTTRTQNPNGSITEISFRLNDAGKTVRVTRTLQPTTKFVPASVAHRMQLKPFGDAALSNEGVTTIGDEVFFKWAHKPSPEPELPAPGTSLGSNGSGSGFLFRQTEKVRKEEAQRHRPPPEEVKEDRTTIKLQHLPLGIDEGQLWMLCSPYGQIRSLQLTRNKDRTLKGYAFLTYMTEEEASNAISNLHRRGLPGSGSLLIVTR